jgi:hypothetical protein
MAPPVEAKRNFLIPASPQARSRAAVPDTFTSSVGMRVAPASGPPSAMAGVVVHHVRFLPAGDLAQARCVFGYRLRRNRAFGWTFPREPVARLSTTDNAMAILEVAVHHVAADEARATRHQDSHAGDYTEILRTSS